LQRNLNLRVSYMSYNVSAAIPFNHRRICTQCLDVRLSISR
jgi:hypothetical protein